MEPWDKQNLTQIGMGQLSNHLVADEEHQLGQKSDQQ
jgi:hypothetical protein